MNRGWRVQSYPIEINRGRNVRNPLSLSRSIAGGSALLYDGNGPIARHWRTLEND